MRFIPAPRAADIDISGTKVSVIGFGVSKSTSGWLLNVLAGDPLEMPQKTTKGGYFPAGTRLALLYRSYPDARGRIWTLVSTEDGLLAYLRGPSKGASRGPSPQCWTQSQIERFFGNGTDQIAVVQTMQAVNSQA